MAFELFYVQESVFCVSLAVFLLSGRTCISCFASSKTFDLSSATQYFEAFMMGEQPEDSIRVVEDPSTTSDEDESRLDLQKLSTVLSRP